MIPSLRIRSRVNRLARLVAVILLAFLALPARGALAHPDSLATIRITVVDKRAHVVARFQILSLLEVFPDIDSDSNSLITAAEVESHHRDILNYIIAHLTIMTHTDRSQSGGVSLTPDVESSSAAYIAPGSNAALPDKSGSVEVAIHYSAECPIQDLVVESSLFHTTSPDHVDMVAIEWAGTTHHFSLRARHPREHSDPSSRGVLIPFMWLGIHHILDGWDHLAFIAVLVLAARGLRSVIAVLTAFTIAHSMTLALSSLQIVDVSGSQKVVEAAIALSVVWVAIENLIRRHTPQARFLEAFVFGLVHGLGFAAVIHGSLIREQSWTLALLGFNVGVELGQIAVVTLIVIVLRLIVRRPSPPNLHSPDVAADTTATSPAFLAPSAIRLVGSAVIAAVGLYWLIQRLFL